MERTYAMNKYQITLTPVDKFYFGGDMTFRVKTKDEKFNEKFNEQFSSYIIQSQLFPQQTSLLGMLRFLILRNAGEDVFANGKIVDKNSAKKLIGGQSFSVNPTTHELNNFGLIKSISHIKVRRTQDGISTDLEFKPLFKELTFDNAEKVLYGQSEYKMPNISKNEYNSKDGLKVLMTDGKEDYELKTEGKEDEKNKNAIFVEDRRIGIDRDIKTGKTKDDALFKQISYRFNNKDAHYCFVFEAEIEDSVPFENYNGQMVSIGGDNSQFIINITKDIKVSNSFKPMSNAVYLLSPAFLQKEEVEQASFAITKLIPFRFLESEMDKTNSYHILSKELKRSQKYELYAPGSVFYFEDAEQQQKFIQSIESKKEFRQIGYNAYK